MGAEIRYGDFIFEKSFTTARLASGTQVKFTRSERALLMLLAGNPGKVLSRNQLLDAVAGHNVDIGDRNIDYTINRLRKKLCDSARDPRLIETRYGEGYMWVAEAAAAGLSAFLIIGPVFGLGRLADDRTARRFLDRLRRACAAAMALDQAVHLAPDWRPEVSAPGTVRFSLDVSFYADAAGLHCAAILRDGQTRQIMHAERLVLGQGEDEQADKAIIGLSEILKGAVWQRIAFVPKPVAAPTDEPLQLRMHRAALLLARSPRAWLENDEQLSRARAEKPDDPELALMGAMQLYYRMLRGGADGFDDAGRRGAIEAEIEATVFDCLPRLEGNPLHVLAIAKLLHFSGRGHLDLAEDLAQRAFSGSPAFAASFVTLAQIKASRGRIGEALDLYDQGLELTEKGSDFAVFILVLRITALLAINDRAAVDRTCAELYAMKPVTRAEIGLLVVPADRRSLPPDLAAQFAGFTLEKVRKVASFLYYISARHFEQRIHRENIMRGFVALATRRFGRDAVSDEVWQAVPDLDPAQVSRGFK